MTYKFFMTAICLVMAAPAFLQVRQCHADELLSEQIKNDPGRALMIEQIERHTHDFIRNASSRSDQKVTIPVVVHIVYNENAENLSEEQIRSQIAVLNRDFRRKNTDTTNVWPVAADPGIEFCLATSDPAGFPTNGITRTSTVNTSFSTSSENVKYSTKGGKDAWPADSYLNIWVCDITGSVLGYAQFPGGKPETDGVVIDYKVFGTGPNVTQGFHLGRTATHEVGHWLNLRHIWGAGDCVTDDFVTDTPKADGPNYGCSKGHISCSNLNMVENYMDYSNDDCMNLFTAGQKTRMLALFAQEGFRHKILESRGCTGQNGVASECSKIRVQVTLDNYPQETSWNITNAQGSVVIKGPAYSSLQKNQTIVLDSCLLAGCYSFTIGDAYGDGICCAYGTGKYSVWKDGVLIGEGGSFGKSARHDFCIENKTPTCTDGLKNGDETGIDCGGSTCDPCPTCTDGLLNGDETGVDCGGSCGPCSTGDSDPAAITGYFFESGWEGWTGGPTDTDRYKGNYSWEGDYSLMIRDNSTDESTVTSPEIDLSSYSRALVQFAFFPNSMEKGEDFFLRYFDGNTWHQLKAYVSEEDFINGNFYEASFTIQGLGTLSSKSRISFRCDASTNADQVYIDAVKISGLPSSARTQPDRVMTSGHYLGYKESVPEITLYPNPASDEVHITSTDPIISVKILDMTGKVYRTIDGKDEYALKTNIRDLEPAIYLVQVQTDDTILSKRLARK